MSSETTRGPRAEERPDRAEMRTGAVLAVVGGAGYLGVLLLHGDLPDASAELALAHIAGRPEWRLLKLALIACVLCWIGAFPLLARLAGPGPARTLGMFATAVLILGTAVMVVEYALIGHAMKGVADRWAGASGPEAERLAEAAGWMLAVTGGLFHAFVALVLGLPFLLLGAGLVLGRGRPRWPGWIAMALGAGPLTAGVSRFAGGELVPYPLLYGGFVIPLCLWLTGMGVLLWRRAGSRHVPR